MIVPLPPLLLDLGERGGQWPGLSVFHWQWVGAFDCDVHEKLLETTDWMCIALHLITGWMLEQ